MSRSRLTERSGFKFGGLRAAAFCAAAITGCAGGAFGQALSVPRVILSTIPTDASSDVPGLPGFKFNQGVTSQFDLPIASRNGQKWIMGATLETPATTANDSIILVFDRSGTITLAAREGDSSAAVTGGASDTWGIFKEIAGINDAGQYVFEADTGPATTVDDVLIKFNGTAQTVLHREGQQALNYGAGQNFGVFESVGILQNGDAFFRPAVSGFTPAKISAYVGNTVVAETDTGTNSTPNGQFFAAQTLDSISATGFVSDSTGLNWGYVGDLNGATTTDGVLVVNNTVFAQEGAAVPGVTGLVAAGITAAPLRMGGLGDWITRASNTGGSGATTTPDWIMVNGSVVNKTGDAVPGGNPSEVFSDSLFASCYFFVAVNCKGDYVYGGLTNETDINFDAVMVLNNQRVVLRQSDGIDLNGDGLANDSLFVQTFNNDDGFLTPDGWLYLNVDVKSDVLNAATDQAHIRVRVFCPGDHNRSGAVSVQDIFDFLADYFAGARRADHNCSGGAASVQDIFDFLGDWFTTCP